MCERRREVAEEAAAVGSSQQAKRTSHLVECGRGLWHRKRGEKKGFKFA
jgi:hypothetical protein